jgi:hypothetical protein
MESTEFGIRSADSPIIMEMLRSKIYSNKPAAVVREYTTNALDEHKTHGVTKSVEVTLPTTTKPEFKVRDYGEGLSKKMIQEVYVMYGCSTKRNTDELTGGLGIGCKAAFAYGSQFTITSWWEENNQIWKAVYAAIIDESHTGTLKVMQPPQLANTGEQTGIEIGVGIASEDISNFRKEVWNLCLTSKVQPKVIGWGDEGIKLPEIITEEASYIRYKKDQSWQYNKYRGAVAVMGNIGYPINTQQLTSITSAMRSMLNESSLHINFDIGELSIASNREELEYNKLTISNITNKAEAILEKILSDSAHKVNSIPCYLDAQKAYGEIIEELENPIICMLEPRIHNDVAHTTVSIAKNIDYIWYEKRYHGGSDKLFADNDRHYTRFGPRSWRNNTLHIVFFDKGTSQANVTKRIKTFMSENEAPSKMKILAFPRDPAKTLDQTRIDVGLPVIDEKKLINIMDYAPEKAAASIKSRNSTAHVELFKMNTERSHYQMETNTWIDAGNVSISSSKAVLCMHLSGVSAIVPGSKDVKNANQTDNKIGKDKLKYIINVAKEYIKFATKDERKLLSDYIVDGALSFEKADLYGVRKKHYKIIDELDNAINLHDFASTLLTRRLEEEHLKGHRLDDHVRVHEILNHKHKENKDTNDYDALTLDPANHGVYSYSYHRQRDSSISGLLKDFEFLFGHLKPKLSKLSGSRLRLLYNMNRISKAYAEPCSGLIDHAKLLGLEKLLKAKTSKDTITTKVVLKTLNTIKLTWPLLDELSERAQRLITSGGNYNDQDRILDDYLFGISSRLSDEDDEKLRLDTIDYNNRENSRIVDSIVKYLSS